MSSEMCRSGNLRHGSEPFYAKVVQTKLSAPVLKLTRLLYDTQQHLTVYVSPERSRILMDVSIDAVGTARWRIVPPRSQVNV
jgi:hypothetical protein